MTNNFNRPLEAISAWEAQIEADLAVQAGISMPKDALGRGRPRLTRAYAPTGGRDVTQTAAYLAGLRLADANEAALD